MTAPVLLIAFAVLATLAGPRLGRRGWVDRSPRLGILAWQALTVGLMFAAILVLRSRTSLDFIYFAF